MRVLLEKTLGVGLIKTWYIPLTTSDTSDSLFGENFFHYQRFDVLPGFGGSDVEAEGWLLKIIFLR